MFSFLTKPHTACPYCYKDVDVSRVAFRCSGRGKPGLPSCDTLTDPKRLREFEDSTPVRPAIVVLDGHGNPVLDAQGDPVDVLGRDSAQCPRCGGSSGIRMCTHCHSILPYGFAAGSPMFGLVGVRNSGKTVLLSVLHKELTRNVARRFNASIDTPGGQSGLVRDLDQHGKSMAQDGGTLPAQTASTGDRKKAPAVYEWKYSKNGRSASTIFSFYDSAGEDIAGQDEALKQLYLSQSTGVILLLDPFSFPENADRANERGAGVSSAHTPESALDGITYILQSNHASKVKRNKKIKVPLAVVVSKIDAFFDQVPSNHPLRRAVSGDDAFDDAESRTIHDHVASMMYQWGGDGLLRKLEQEYQNYRIFGVSALGAEPDYRGSKINSRGLLPLRVADPLLWLMANSGFIPTVKV